MTPIDPPGEFREVNIEHRSVRPRLVGSQYLSSDELQRMIRPLGPEKENFERNGNGDRSDKYSKDSTRDFSHRAEKGSTPSKDEYKSKDSLQQETKKSVETLFPVTPPGSTGKPTKTEPKTYETEKGEPPKRPVPLNERNLEWWSSLPQNQPDNSSNLMRWRHSINFSDEALGKPEKKSTPGESMVNHSGSSTPDKRADPDRKPDDRGYENGPGRYRSAPDQDRRYDRREDRGRDPESKNSENHYDVPPQVPLSSPPRENVDDLLIFKRPSPRVSKDEEETLEMRQSQRNRYKAKIDKAKRNFIEGESKASVGDLSKPKEEFENKHNVTLDKFMRKIDPPRGPLLQKFNDPIFKSNVDIQYKEVKPNYKTPEPLWDDEYKKLVAKAENMWKEYRMKSNPNLYAAKNRAYSMGVLETDLDTGLRGESGRTAGETNLDDMHRQEPESVRGRARTKSSNQMEDGQIDTAHSRAKSMDYLIDNRDKIEPPENELHKTVARILGQPPIGHTPSEHEIRFKKSLEKLHVPDWYLESDYVGKPGELDRSSRQRRTMPTASSRATTPGYGYAEQPSESFGTADISYGSTYQSRPESAVPTPAPTATVYQPQKPYRPPVDEPTVDTRYTKPFSYIDDSKSPTMPKFDKPRTAPPMPPSPERRAPGQPYVPSVVPGSDLLRRVAPPIPPRPHEQEQVQARKPEPLPRHFGREPQESDVRPPRGYDLQSDRRRGSSHEIPPRVPSRAMSEKDMTTEIFSRYKDEINELWHSRKSLRQSQTSLHKSSSHPTEISARSTQDIFTRYKDEINEMWHSRKSLRQSQTSLHKSAAEPPPRDSHVLQHRGSGGSVPVATVKPRPQGQELSPTPSSQRTGAQSQASTMPHETIVTIPYHPPSRPRDLDIPPTYAAPAPPSEFDDVLYTSTPCSSGHLPRKQYPTRAEPVPEEPAPPVPTHSYSKNTTPGSAGAPKPYAKTYTGYTVAPVPASYNEPRSRSSRVIEVADLGHGSGSASEFDIFLPFFAFLLFSFFFES